MSGRIEVVASCGHVLSLDPQTDSASGLALGSCPRRGCDGIYRQLIPRTARSSIFSERRGVDDVRLDRRDTLAYQRGMVT